MRRGEKYIWSFLGTFTLKYEVQVCSKLSTWHPTYTHSCTFRLWWHSTKLIWLWAFYSTGRDLTSAKTPKRQLAVKYSSHWLETAALAAFPAVEITDFVHTLFNMCLAGSLWMHFLSWQFVSQCGHKIVSLSWINVLSCNPCTSLAAVESGYYIASWHRMLASVQTYFSLPSAPLK